MTDYNTISRRIHRIWWVPMITGLIAIGFGVWCFLSPVTSLPVFAYIFCAGMLLAGCLNISYSFMNTRVNTNWGWSLALGLLEIVCGVWLLCLPESLLTVAFVYAMGIWMIVAAINSIGEAAYFSRYSLGWTIWMVLLLIATVFFCLFFIASPLFGEIAGWVWIGVSLELFGIWRIALALKLKSLNRVL